MRVLKGQYIQVKYLIAPPCHRQQSSDPIFRGRKLVLNYTSGSPCDSPLTKPLRRSLADNYHEIHEDEEDQDIDSLRSDSRRKSTIISFQCEHDPLAHKVHLSFVGATHDECTYFFEAKSTAACGGVNQKEQALGPGGVFGVMYLNHRPDRTEEKS